MTFTLINTLAESRLFPSTKSLTRYNARDAADLAYLYIVSLRILLADPDTKKWAEDYCSKTTVASSFARWRSDGTDLYVLMHALTTKTNPLDDVDREFRDDLPLNEKLIHSWLRRVGEGDMIEPTTRGLFGRLDAMFRMRDASMRAIRRLTLDWPELSHRERRLVITRLLQFLRSRAQNGEVLSKITHIAKLHRLEIADACNLEDGEDCDSNNDGETDARRPFVIHANQPKPKKKPSSLLAKLAGVAGFATGIAATNAMQRPKMENATAGATGSGNIAATPGGLGAGFDNDYSKSIYPPPRKAEKKPLVVRRAPLKEDDEIG